MIAMHASFRPSFWARWWIQRARNDFPVPGPPCTSLRSGCGLLLLPSVCDKHSIKYLTHMLTTFLCSGSSFFSSSVSETNAKPFDVWN